VFTVFVLVNVYFLAYWCWTMGKIVVQKVKNLIQKVKARTRKGVDSASASDVSMTRLERSQVREEMKEGHDQTRLVHDSDANNSPRVKKSSLRRKNNLAAAANDFKSEEQFEGTGRLLLGNKNGPGEGERQ